MDTSLPGGEYSYKLFDLIIRFRDFIDVKKVKYDKDTETYFCTYSSVGPAISQKVPLIDGLVRFEFYIISAPKNLVFLEESMV